MRDLALLGERKTVDAAVAQTNEPGSRLRSELNVFELTAIGLAVIVGGGIFATAPLAYRDATGPSIVISFGIAAFTCLLVGLCYAESATRIPVAGSVYTFAYVTFGRHAAWIVAWLLALEYTAGPAVVAQSWSRYLTELLARAEIGIDLASGPVNWGAVLVVGLVTVLLSGGLRIASRFTMVATAAKIGVLVFAVVVGIVATRPEIPFVPAAEPLGAGIVQPLFVEFLGGTITGAAVLFYAFIGFDSVSTMAEEARFPRRDLSRAILWSLGIATVLYLAVALVIVKLASAKGLDGATPTLSSIFDGVGLGLPASVLRIGALIGLTTGIVVLLLGQSRVALAMGRDRFLPAWVTKLSWRRTPNRAIVFAGVICAVLAGFVPGRDLQVVINQGTLLLFVIVCWAAWRLRDDIHPRPAGSFRVLALPIIAVVGGVASAFLFAVIVSEPTVYLLLYITWWICVYAVLRRLENRSEPPVRLARLIDRRPRRSRWRWPGDE